MCGPACPEYPNIEGVRVPHIHPVVKQTFGGGLPLHRISNWSKGKARVLPRTSEPVPTAHLAIQRDELRRREAQMGRRRQLSAATETDPDGLQLNMYTSGKIHQMNQRDVKEKWKIGRFLPEANDNEYGLDHPHSVGTDAGKARPAGISKQGTGQENVPAAIRQPAAQGPSLDLTANKDAPRLAVKDSTTFSRAENGLVGKIRQHLSSRAIPGSRQRDALTRRSDSSQYADNIEMQTLPSVGDPENGQASQVHIAPSPEPGKRQPSAVLRQRASTVVINPESCQARQVPVGASPRLGQSQYAGVLRHQTSPPVVTQENRPFARLPSRQFPRLAKSQSAGVLRCPTSGPVFNVENSPSDNNNLEETFTLRHIQRMASSRVRQRLQVIEENYRRFQAIAKYEQVTPEIFHSIGHLRGLKATLDENNSQYGGSEVEDAAWEDFLGFLGTVERGIEKEDARLRIVTQKRSAERLVASEGKTEGEEERRVDDQARLKRLSRVSQFTVESFETAKETPEICEIPPLQTELKRSLSSPACPTHRRSASL